MSDVVDLSFISGVISLDIVMRLLRLQVDIWRDVTDQRTLLLAVIERSFHELTGEVSRGFGQMQQQLTRHEKRFDGLDAALAKLGTDLAESTERILREIRASGR